MHQTHIIAAIVGAAVAGSAGYLLAGPLDPPPGPVQPSFRTIQEVYDRIDLLTPGPFCDNGPWDFFYTPDVSPDIQEIIAGTGVLHAAVVRRDGRLSLFTDGGTTQIANLEGPTATGFSKVILNVTYTDGLWLRSVGTFPSAQEDKHTILYRADPPAASVE